MKKNNYIKIMTPEFRISFPNLAEPKAINNVGDPKFGLKMLFPKKMSPKNLELYGLMQAACKKVSLEYFNNTLPPNLKKPLRDGNETGYSEDADYYIANARTSVRPGIVDSKNEEIKDKQKIEEICYAGSWARATLLVGATDTAGNKTCFFVLQNLQWLRDDLRFGNKKLVTEEFEIVQNDIVESISDFDATF